MNKKALSGISSVSYSQVQRRPQTCHALRDYRFPSQTTERKKTKKNKKTYLDKNGNQNTLPGDINDHNFYYWILMIWSVHLSHHNSWKYKLAISLNYKEVQSTLITGMCNPDEISKINITTKYIFFCWTNCV